MAQEQRKVQNQLRKEERQYFCSFLNGMGEEDRCNLVNSVKGIQALCAFLFDTFGVPDILVGLTAFVEQQGDISFPQDPLEDQKLQVFDQMKAILENETTITSFRYTQLDRFLQHLNQHYEIVQGYLMNEEGMEAFLPDHVDVAEEVRNFDQATFDQFFKTCISIQSGLIDPVSNFSRCVNDVKSILEQIGVYKAASKTVQEAMEHGELTTLGSDDAGN